MISAIFVALSEPSALILAGIVAAGYGVQSAAGFGSSLICVTLGANLVPLPELVALLMPLSVLQTGLLSARERRAVAWRLLLTRILPLMGAGLAAGFLLASWIGGAAWLKPAVGALVMALALQSLWRLRRPPAGPGSPAASIVAMLGAGVIHGITTTGGPLLVYALGRESLDKARFRATLLLVWFLLNTALVTGYALQGRYDAEVIARICVMGLGLPAGMFIGDALHRRVDERRFKAGVFLLLLAAALALIVR